MVRTALPAVGNGTTSFTQLTTFSSWQYELIVYSAVVAGFALLAAFLYSVSTRSEISKRWRPATTASSLICLVAFVAYAIIVMELVLGFTHVGANWVPKASTQVTSLRYMDWSVTVPLLTVEFLAVCTVAVTKSVYTRFVAMAAAFLMIITGFFGVIDVGSGTPGTAELLIWGAISTVFFIVIYLVFGRAMRQTKGTVSDDTYTSLKNSATLLLSLFGVYPLVYLIPIWAGAGSAGWAVTVQVAFSFADIGAKAGFGALIHKVAKLRTAEDAETTSGSTPDFYPAEVYVSGTALSSPHPAPELVGASVGDGASRAGAALDPAHEAAESARKTSKYYGDGDGDGSGSRPGAHRPGS